MNDRFCSRLIRVLLPLFFSCWAQTSPSTTAPARRYGLADLPIRQRIHVPPGPGWLAIGFDSVWLSKTKSHALFRIDPKSATIQARIDLGRSEPDLAIGIDAHDLWVADPHHKTVTRISATQNRVAQILPVDLAEDPEGSFGVGFGSLWMLTSSSSPAVTALKRINPADGTVQALLKPLEGPRGVLAAFESVWISGDNGHLLKVDPAQNRISAYVHVGDHPRFMASGFGSIWVVNQGDGTLVRVDPNKNQVQAEIPLGVPGDGGDIAVDEHSIWVSAEGTPLIEVDPISEREKVRFEGGKHLDTLRVGFGYAWLNDEDSGELWCVDLARLPH